MAAQMCRYGNCQEMLDPKKGSFKLTVTESNAGSVWERASFCCYEHAWRWIKERDETVNGWRDRPAKDVAR